MGKAGTGGSGTTSGKKSRTTTDVFFDGDAAEEESWQSWLEAPSAAESVPAPPYQELAHPLFMIQPGVGTDMA